MCMYDGHVCDLRKLRVLRLRQEPRYRCQHIAWRNSERGAGHVLLMHLRIGGLLLPGLAGSKRGLLWMQ